MSCARRRARLSRPSLWGAVALIALTGCSQAIQTSSGRDYLAARPEWASAASTGGAAADGRASVDRAVYEAASAEPLLRFPARIGLARVHGQAVTPIPPEEAEAWAALARDKGAAFGEFVPLSPLVVELAGSAYGGDTARAAVDRIRIGAARQHVDAVLVYEVRDGRDDAGSLLSVLDLTIVGAWLVPSRSVAGRAVASALLVDVRNGYPYGTASASAEETGIATTAHSSREAGRLAARAEVAAVRKLTGEAETMLSRLKGELETKELAQLRAEKAKWEGRPAAAR